MKKLFSLICLLALAAGSALAQKMVIKTTDGEIVNYKVSKLEYVTFEEEYVDLGLPSGTLWARCNLGADSPEQYGYFYAWGETKPKSNYTWSTYTHCNGSQNALTKYNTTDGLMELKPVDDAAMVNLGIEWQMPTEEQIEELINSEYTTWEWTQLNGVNGMKITSKSNGNSIFFPAAGIQNDTRHISEGEIGLFWSRTRSEDPIYVYTLYIRSYGPMWSLQSREGGKSIRPVVCTNPPQPVLVEQIVLTPPILTLELNDYQNLAATVLPEDASNKTLKWESSNTSIATVSGNGRVTAVAEGTCTITCRATDGSGVKAECQVTAVVDNSGTIDGKDYIDLDLPSGTLWAACNVGASSPEEFGAYLAWGETKPHGTGLWTTYIWCNGTSNTLTKYCNDSSKGYNGFTDDLTELEPEDDAATANWGENWQMPSVEQIEEILNEDYTTVTWATRAGQTGCKITSKINGRSIFLPAAGERAGWSMETNVGGEYYSRSLNTSTCGAYTLGFLWNEDEYWGGYFNFYIGGNRSWLGSVRPVRKK